MINGETLNAPLEWWRTLTNILIASASMKAPCTALGVSLLLVLAISISASGAPELPAGVDVFSPPSRGTDGPAVIAAHTQTAGPGEIVVLAGADFTAATTFAVFGQTNAGDATLIEQRPIVADHVAASIVLPKALPVHAMYIIWPKVGERWGRPIAINRTDPWWIGPAKADPGETVSIYGRNLSHDGGTTKAWIYIESTGGGAGQWVTAKTVNPYCVGFTVPALSPGDYRVWIHNGHGGTLGWGEPLTLTVIAKSPFADHALRMIDVKKFGAIGDGKADDTAAIQAALKSAGDAAPATLFFPGGTYTIHETLQPRANVSWLGEGRDKTVLKVGSGFAKSPFSAFIFSDAPEVHTVSFSRLSLEANGNCKGKGLIRFQHHQRVRITDCRLDWSGTPFTFSLGANDELVVSRNELIGDSLFLGNSKQVVVRDNVIRLTDSSQAAIISWGGSEVAVTGNTAGDFDPAGTSLSGVGTGRFVVTQSHPDSNRHMYIADNTTRDMAPPRIMPDANQGEQILFEVGTSHLAAKPLAVTETTATFAQKPPVNASTDVVIVAGRGVGQFRRVAAVDGNTITVSPAWSVHPDANSVLGIGPAQTRTVIYHNTLDGKSDFPTYVTASVAMNMYGNVSDVVFANNTATDMYGGLVAEFSQVPDPKTPTPSALYFNLITDNTLHRSHRGLTLATYALTENTPGTVGHLGNTYRRNGFTDLVEHGLFFGSGDTGYTGGDLHQNVYEYNGFTNVPIALHVGMSVPWSKKPVSTQFSNLILYANGFDRGGAQAAGSKAVEIDGVTTSLWSALNRWTGFESSFVDQVESAR